MKTFKTTSLSLLGASAIYFTAHAQTDINLTGYTMSFNDEFTSLSATTTSPKPPATKWYAGYPPNGSAGIYGYAVDDINCLSISNGILVNKLKLSTSIGSTGQFCGGPVGMKNAAGTAMVSVGTISQPAVRTHSSWQWYGWVGMRFTVGATAVTISQLGRYAISSNTQTHQVRIFNATTGADVAKAMVNCAGQTGFVYSNIIGGNVTLTANTSYFVMTDNYNSSNSDYFYNTNTPVTTTSDITVNESRWGSWHAGALFSVDSTTGGFSQKYGYFEIRAKLPSCGTGAWPSFWMKTLGDIEDPTANILEVDIFEWYGTTFSANPQQAVIAQASHNWNPNGTQSDPPAHLYSPSTPMPGNAYPWAGFHIYGFKVDPANCTWFIDGVQTNQIPTPANYLIDPLWILLEYNIGGNWPLDGLVANSQFEIDWARVYTMPSSHADTFTRADSTALGNTSTGSYAWVENSAPDTIASVPAADALISANQLKITTASPANSDTMNAYVNANLDGRASYGVSFTFKLGSGLSNVRSGFFLLPRAQGNDLVGNYGWVFRESATVGTFDVRVYTGGVRSGSPAHIPLDSMPTVVATGLATDTLHDIEVTVIGNTATLLINGTAVDSNRSIGSYSGNGTADHVMFGHNALDVSSRGLEVFIDNLTLQ